MKFVTRSISVSYVWSTAVGYSYCLLLRYFYFLLEAKCHYIVIQTQCNMTSISVILRLVESDAYPSWIQSNALLDLLDGYLLRGIISVSDYMKYMILILIIIIISLGQILLSYIANTSRTHACPCTCAHACTSTHAHTPLSPPTYRLALFICDQP